MRTKTCNWHIHKGRGRKISFRGFVSFSGWGAEQLKKNSYKGPISKKQWNSQKFWGFRFCPCIYRISIEEMLPGIQMCNKMVTSSTTASQRKKVEEEAKMQWLNRGLNHQARQNDRRCGLSSFWNLTLHSYCNAVTRGGVWTGACD